MKAFCDTCHELTAHRCQHMTADGARYTDVVCDQCHSISIVFDDHVTVKVEGSPDRIVGREL
jgi:hypothetical protein